MGIWAYGIWASVCVSLTEIFIKIRRTPEIIRINYIILPETRVRTEHFFLLKYGYTYISFYAIVFEIQAKTLDVPAQK